MGAAQPQGVHVGLPAMSVLFALNGVGEGNCAGHVGSCAGTPSNNAANPVQPNGAVGTHEYWTLQSGSAQSMLASPSSSMPLRQSSVDPDPPVPPVPELLLLLELDDEVAPPVPPSPPVPPMPPMPLELEDELDELEAPPPPTLPELELDPEGSGSLKV